MANIPNCTFENELSNIFICFFNESVGWCTIASNENYFGNNITIDQSCSGENGCVAVFVFN